MKARVLSRSKRNACAHELQLASGKVGRARVEPPVTMTVARLVSILPSSAAIEQAAVVVDSLPSPRGGTVARLT